MRSATALLVSFLTAWACAGCGPGPAESRIGYYLPRPRDLARVKRAVLVELVYEGQYPGLEWEMTQALAKAIQGRNLFRVEVVRGDGPELRELSHRAQGCKTLKDLGDLRKAFKCDAVLVGSIQHFQPHPHMQIGLYLQLLDLRRGRLVWGLEHTWDTADRATETRIRKFFDSEIAKDRGPLDWRLAAVSPTVFRKYVAHEVAGTLSTEPPPAEPARKSFVEFVMENFRRIRHR